MAKRGVHPPAAPCAPERQTLDEHVAAGEGGSAGVGGTQLRPTQGVAVEVADGVNVSVAVGDGVDDSGGGTARPPRFAVAVGRLLAALDCVATAG